MNNSGFVSDNNAAGGYDGPMIAVAQGAMAQGFMVRHRGRRMFVKRLRSEFMGEPRCRAAFEKEFELGYSLEHPGIVRYYELREDDGAVDILMELVEGDSLTSFMEKNSGYFRKKANFYRFVSQLASAVGYLHQHGIVHLDLKPENIMLTRIDRSVKVIDLGLGASDMFSDSKGGSPLTSAPEVTSGEGTVTAAADIYSIGAIMEYIVANAPGCRIPGIGKIIARCKAAAPAERFQHASDIYSRLTRARHRRTAIIYSVIASFMIAAATLFIITRQEDTKNNQRPTAAETATSSPSDSLPAYTKAHGNNVPSNNHSASHNDANNGNPAESVETPATTPGDTAKAQEIKRLQSMVAEKCRRDLPPLIARYQRMLSSDTIDIREYDELSKDCGEFVKSVIGDCNNPESIYGGMFPSLDRDDIFTAVYDAALKNGLNDLLEISRQLLHRLNTPRHTD